MKRCFHDLRQTAATLLLGRGVHPKIASEMLGHSTIVIAWISTRTSHRPCKRDTVNALDAVLAT